MKVNLYATLRHIVGQKTVELDLSPGTTVRQVVQAVVDHFPALRPQLLDEQGELYGHIHVFINGRDAHYLDDLLETQIQPDDTVDIFPPVGGGW